MCVSFIVKGFRWAQAMSFTIDEINRNTSLLPNVTLSYSLYDDCLTLGVGLRAALSMVSGTEEQFQVDDGCAGSPPVFAIAGHVTPITSTGISSVLRLYRVPLVSFPLKTPFTITKFIYF